MNKFTNFVHDWFTWEGRLSRSQFIFRYFIFAGVYYFLFIRWLYETDIPEWVICGIGGLFLVLTVIPLMIRRIHDLGKSENYIWLTLIPFVNLYYGLPLFFKKGVLGTNQFGNEAQGWF